MRDARVETHAKTSAALAQLSADALAGVGSPGFGAWRERLKARYLATSHIVLFLEFLPHTVHSDTALDERYERVATVMRGFFDSLMTNTRTTPFPADELASAWQV